MSRQRTRNPRLPGDDDAHHLVPSTRDRVINRRYEALENKYPSYPTEGYQADDVDQRADFRNAYDAATMQMQGRDEFRRAQSEAMRRMMDRFDASTSPRNIVMPREIAPRVLNNPKLRYTLYGGVEPVESAAEATEIERRRYGPENPTWTQFHNQQIQEHPTWYEGLEPINTFTPTPHTFGEDESGPLLSQPLFGSKDSLANQGYDALDRLLNNTPYLRPSPRNQPGFGNNRTTSNTGPYRPPAETTDPTPNIPQGVASLLKRLLYG